MKTNWQTKKLGEIGTIFNGNSINERVKKDRYFGLQKGVPFIGTKDIDYDAHTINYENGVKIPIDEKKFKIAHKNSVLICSEGGSAGKKIAFNTKDICFGNKLFAFEAGKDVEPKFIYYFYLTNFFSRLFQGQMNGLIGGVSISNFKNIEIPLPPLSDQKRIIKTLDEVFKKLEKAKNISEKNLQNSKELFESSLAKIFVDLRKNGKYEKFGNLCKFVRGPFGGSLKKTIFKKEGFVVYEQQHAIYNQFQDVRYFIDEKKFNEMKRFELFPGDLIMSCSGTMGKIAIVPSQIKRGIINQALLKLTPSKKILGEYLKYWMQSSDFQDGLKIYSKGAAIKNVVSVKILKEIEIPFTEVSNQKTIIKKLDQLSEQTKNLELIYQKKISAIEELKRSILSKAFSKGL